jgi:SAM-dependent methyltransferase
MSEQTDPTASSNPDVYYRRGDYWNDLPEVVQHINIRITGAPTLNWIDYLTSMRPNGFDSVLVLNCGNGWVERELLSSGLVRHAVGIDISEELLEQAREAASLADLNADYFGMNINRGNIPGGSYDLVLNHAAGHHIANLDRVLRQVASAIEPDGLFVSWDYTGPHRNQYGARAWEKVVEVNSQLPNDLQADLQYPHLPTMLIDDPSEAIHSELFLEVKNRYFDFVYEKRIGGAIAYPLLTFNKNIFGARTDYSSKYVMNILQEDANDTDLNPGDSLFSFVIARVKDLKSITQSLLDQWTIEEDNRESQAITNGGLYYRPAIIGELYERIEQARVQLLANEGHLAHQAVAIQQSLELQKTFDNLVIDYRRVNEEKNAILNSRFWKYGQPIRKVVAILRRAN